MYPYTEVLPRTFFAKIAKGSWSHEDIFSKEPFRRMVIAMFTNQVYLGTNCDNRFHYQKISLSQTVVHRNGQTNVGTPVSTNLTIAFTSILRKS